MRKILLFLLSFWLIGPIVTIHADKIKKDIEIITWEEVNELIPRYTKFIVKDFVTGKEFHVQRRAGSRHADVQPLTKEDTKIMNEIYKGKWSWRRRAIVVIHGKKKIAASMHGMPHGAGAIKNNFPGHFCIHFYGSTTHRRNFMDLSHKLMILKAAGELDKYLHSAGPYEVITAFIAGIKEDDESIIDIVALQNEKWDEQLAVIENVAISGMPQLPEEDLTTKLELSVPIELDWHLKGSGRKRGKGEVHLVRTSPFDSWKVDNPQFLNDFLQK